MPAEIESGVFARQTPWHGLGVVVPDALKAEDAVVMGGLDWIVEKQPLFVQKEGAYVELPDRFALTRNTDGQMMSIVSDVYKPFQNREAFTFMDNLVDSGDAKYETALSLRGGRVVALTMHVPMDVLIGGEDRHEAYLLLRTTHDGSGRISVYVVMIRVVCMNTLTMAINGASHSWGVTHTANVAGKVQEARESLGMTFAYAEAFKKEADALTKITVTDDDIVKMLEAIMPVKKRRDDDIDAIVENCRISDNIANFRGTGWGFLNGLTEWQQHGRANRSDQAAFTRTLDGTEAKMRATLRTRLLARV